MQTATGCPSQWDLWDENDNYYYARYRWGGGELTQYTDQDWVGAPFDFDEESNVPFYRQNPKYVRRVAYFEHGDPYDGFIELSEFCRHAGIQLSDELMHTNFGEHLRDQLVTEAGFTFLLEENDGKTEG